MLTTEQMEKGKGKRLCHPLFLSWSGVGAVTCCEAFLGWVAGHVAPAGDEGHLILGVGLQVSDGVLILIVCEIDGGAVPWHIFEAIGELNAINLSQGFEPGDESCGVCDIFHLHLAGSIQACHRQKRGQLQR